MSVSDERKRKRECRVWTADRVNQREIFLDRFFWARAGFLGGRKKDREREARHGDECNALKFERRALKYVP